MFQKCSEHCLPVVVNTTSGGGGRGGAVNQTQFVAKICFERMSWIM
jgi:hypothetical protein